MRAAVPTCAVRVYSYMAWDKVTLISLAATTIWCWAPAGRWFGFPLSWMTHRALMCNRGPIRFPFAIKFRIPIRGKTEYAQYDTRHSEIIIISFYNKW